MGFADSLQLAGTNIDSSGGQQRFTGNAITAEYTEKQLLDILASRFRSGGNIALQIGQLVDLLAARRWKITAGLHVGGIGGAVGAPDTRPHITLSTGHHVRFQSNLKVICEITGPNITDMPARDARANPQPRSDLERIKNEYELSNQEAAKVVARRHSTGCTEAAAVEFVKANRK